MKLIKINGKYVLNCTYAERHAAKDAGMRWNAATKEWYTTDIVVAKKLKQYAIDKDVLESVETEEKKTMEAVAASKAVDVTVDLVCKAGLEYMPFQRAGIAYGLSRDNVLIADEMGLGKTIQALGICNNSDAQKILIICPASLKLNWRRESEKWLTGQREIEILNGKESERKSQIYIINYDILSKHKWIAEKEWDIVICDESHYCLVGNTSIKTNLGIFTIEEIVKNKLNVSVLSCNLSHNALEYKPVIGWFKNELSQKLVKVKTKHGEIVCTGNHKIWTENGYVEAAALTRGTILRIMPQEVSNPDQRQGNGSFLQSQLCFENEQRKKNSERENPSSTQQSINRKKMCLVSKSFPISFKGGQIQPGTAFLRPQLCGKMENEFALPYRPKKTIHPYGTASNPRQQETRCKQANEGKQSNEQSRNSRKGAAENDWSNFFSTWRKRKINDPSSNSFSKIKSSNRVCDFNLPGKRPIPFPSNLLQSRFGNPPSKNSYRNRWAFTSPQKMEISRQAQNRNFECTGVESVEIYEQASNGKFGNSSATNKFVYDIEVAGNHNYFANNILVSNCKNPKAARTKACFAILKKAKKKIMLTGTPIMNRPIELQTVLSALGCDFASNWFSYAKKYCAAYKNRFGWDVSGASNLEELQEKLRASVMVRRLKKDVLLDLPEKTRQIIEIPADKFSSSLKKETKIMQSYEEKKKELCELKKKAAEQKDDAGFKDKIESLRNAMTLDFAEISRVRHETALAKTEFTTEYITDMLESRDKIILFAHHIDVIDKLCSAFPDIAVKFTGEMSAEDKQKSVDRFQNDPSCKIFIGSIMAAGVGITLTAANTVVFHELEWTPSAISQAEDRAHRIGQKENVLIQHLVIDGSIDSMLAKKIKAKQEVIEKALDKAGLTEEIEL